MATIRLIGLIFSAEDSGLAILPPFSTTGVESDFPGEFLPQCS